MLETYAKLIDDLCYRFSLAELRVENEKRKDLSHNSSLYKKIICKESGQHTISSIAKLLSVNTTAVTQKVNELESKNYVYKEQCKKDKRVSYLFGVDKHCPCKEGLLKRDKFVFEGLENEYSNEQIGLFIEMLNSANELYSNYDNSK